MSVAGPTVAAMSAHVCVWFEDSWPDHACACGARAVAVVDELGETVFGVLEAAQAPQEHFSLSA